MASTLSVTFHGLCLLAGRGKNRTDAVCAAEAGAHTPVLALKILDIDLPLMTWKPDMVGHDQSGDEIGFWNLTGQRFTLGVDGPRAWSAGPQAVRLSQRHANCAPKPDGDIEQLVRPAQGPQGCILELLGGRLGYLSPPTIDIVVVQNGNPSPAGAYASAVRWEGTLDGHPKNVTGGKISLRRDDRHIVCHVTNVAKVRAPQGLAHFSYYYDLIDGVDPQDAVTLSAAAADTNVLDCVPPTDTDQ